jgi:hypothetical protein
MKDCKKIHILLSLYAEGQLSVREKTLVEKHLAFCVTARREMEQLSHLRQTLTNAPEPKMPHDLHDKIMARVTGKMVPIPKHRSFWTYTPWALGTAAVLAFMVLNQDSDWIDHWKVSAPKETRDEKGVLRRQAEPEKVLSGVSSSISTNAPAPKAKATLAQNFAKEQPAAKDDTAKGILDNEATDQIESRVRSDKNLALKQKKAESYRASALAQPMAGLASPPAVQKPSAESSLKQMDVLEKKATVAEAPAMPSAPALQQATGMATGSDMAANTSAVSPEPFTLTWNGTNGFTAVEQPELVTNAVTFQKDWNLLRPGEPLPTVDFTKQAVILLMAGTKPTPGYSIKVSRLEEKADQLVIWYKVGSPSAGSVLAQVLAYPWSMQVILKPNKSVVFNKDE